VSKPDIAPAGDGGIADPTTEAFWAACRQHKLLVQRCRTCGHHQFYPRPLCLACESTDLGWVETKGEGEIYSVTTVRVPVADELPPPYLLAIVTLDEGPRLLTNIDGTAAAIGDRVAVGWRERLPLPPLPIFRPVGDKA
jgi:uncharacterized OB-fold protein